MPQTNEEIARNWYDHKAQVMEQVMGKKHDIVMHAIFPYTIGGGLDLYYYPNGIPGTGIATMELSELPEQGSSNKAYSCYEMVMFTKLPLALDDVKNLSTPFGYAHNNIHSVLNHMARFSATATLNGNDTCEFPADMQTIGGKCFIFQNYRPYHSNSKRIFGILAVIEIFRSEMDFARKAGGDKLFDRLKAAGHYPYSDLDRSPAA